MTKKKEPDVTNYEIPYPYIVEDVWNFVYIIDSDTKSHKMLNWINEKFEIETTDKFGNDLFTDVLVNHPEKAPRILFEFVLSPWCGTSVWYKDMREIPSD